MSEINRHSHSVDHFIERMTKAVQGSLPEVGTVYSITFDHGEHSRLLELLRSYGPAEVFGRIYKFDSGNILDEMPAYNSLKPGVYELRKASDATEGDGK